MYRDAGYIWRVSLLVVLIYNIFCQLRHRDSKGKK